MEIVLVKLLTGDHIIGILMLCNESILLVYAPISIKLVNDQYQYTPYEILSKSTISSFSVDHVLNITTPKDTVKVMFEKAAKIYYKDYEKISQDHKKLSSQLEDEGEFDEDLLNEMFDAFTKQDKGTIH